MSAPMLIDIVDMPDYNPESNKLGKSQRDVSEGRVYYGMPRRPAPLLLEAFREAAVATVRCVDHGAMNLVNPERTIWRCIACNAGAYDARDGAAT